MLLAKYEKEKIDAMVQHEHRITPKISSVVEKKQVESDVWYLDNGVMSFFN